MKISVEIVYSSEMEVPDNINIGLYALKKCIEGNVKIKKKEFSYINWAILDETGKVYTDWHDEWPEAYQLR